MSHLDSLGDQIYLKLYMVSQMNNGPAWTKDMRYFANHQVLIAWSYDQVSLYGTNNNHKLVLANEIQNEPEPQTRRSDMPSESGERPKFIDKYMALDVTKPKDKSFRLLGWYTYKQLFEEDDVILDALFHAQLNLFVLGCKSGQITIWLC
jgi:hypothetical protein